MRIIEPNYEILDDIDGMAMLRDIERAGRVCYKSEDRITDTSAPAFVKMLISRGHEAMVEHAWFSVKFVCDRGVSHELARHRVVSFAQESTRYCNYGNEKFGRQITVIEPCFLEKSSFAYGLWAEGVAHAEWAYFALLDDGARPEEARSVLPNSLKTEVVITANLREWRHILKLRTAETAHPQMLQLMRPLLAELKVRIPVIFDDIIAA